METLLQMALGNALVATVLAVMFQGTTNSVQRTIFLDGRPLPQDPNPSWMGSSTGRWDGDTLVVETGGFNDRSWLGSISAGTPGGYDFSHIFSINGPRSEFCS